MSDQAQSVVGRALLNNPNSRVGFVSGFNEFYDIDRTKEHHTFNDHVLGKAEIVDPFFLFAGVLSANDTVKVLT
eukprot:1309444-Prymnesium_polylepis.1